jgi:hypothetical protein
MRTPLAFGARSSAPITGRPSRRNLLAANQAGTEPRSGIRSCRARTVTYGVRPGSSGCLGGVA